MATGYGHDGPGSNPGGGEIFRTCPDRPWGPPSFLYNGYRVFPGGKERPGRDADLSHLLVPWSRKSRDIPLLLLWAVRPVQSLSACTGVHFTLPLLRLRVKRQPRTQLQLREGGFVTEIGFEANVWCQKCEQKCLQSLLGGSYKLR